LDLIELLTELQGVTWANHIQGKALRIPRNKFAAGFVSGRAYYLGFGNVIIGLTRDPIS